jgi:gamma-glutamylcyclotransferase (GGCT)/AIG2-like uncharacterized protein YtfP
MLYFAFGSNMDTAQMRQRCPSAQVVASALLPRHRLVFNGFSRAWGGAVASVVRDPTCDVPGVLYDLDADDVARLDAFEGHPWVYARCARRVRLSDGAQKRAQVYIHTQPERVGRPSWRYTMTIWRAYRTRGFDDAPLLDAALAETF